MLQVLKNCIYITAIIIAALIVANNSKTTKLNNNFDTSIPQEYMQDVKVTHFNIDGSIKDYIHAQYWAYLPEQGISSIVNPNLEVIKPNNSVWRVHAKYGIANHPKLDGKISKLELTDKVIVERPEAPAISPITVTTTKLFYYPENEYLQTNEFVTMVKPGLQITGVGLEGYLNKNSVELQNDVKTIYTSTS